MLLICPALLPTLNPPLSMKPPPLPPLALLRNVVIGTGGAEPPAATCGETLHLPLAVEGTIAASASSTAVALETGSGDACVGQNAPLPPAEEYFGPC